MKNRIISIKEKKPVESTLPDGFYQGAWSGRLIEVRYGGRLFEIETVEGVRGSGIPVIVEVKDSVATFDEISQ